MKKGEFIFAVDSHTMGEPTRVVIGGVKPIPGKSMVEKRRYVEMHLDHLRTALMHEPRGHRDMFGSILLPPVHPDAGLGIIFMDGAGYLNMCIHGTIGAVTVALEMGIIESEGPVTRVTLDTPAGLVLASAQSEGEGVGSVTVENVPSFLYRSGIRLNVPGVGELEVDIAFGGNFFALVDASDLGIPLIPENVESLIDLGMKVRHRINQELKVSHPLHPALQTIDLVEIHGAAQHPDAHGRNIVIFGNGQFDRSPCGTGTCARMATLFSKGKLGLNQEFIHESIIGTTFRGKLTRQTTLNNIPCVVPEITGRAFVTGIQQFVINPEDPLKHGFQI